MRLITKGMLISFIYTTLTSRWGAMFYQFLNFYKLYVTNELPEYVAANPPRWILAVFIQHTNMIPLILTAALLFAVILTKIMEPEKDDVEFLELS